MAAIRNSIVSAVMLIVLICSLLFCVLMFVGRAEQESKRRAYQWLHEGAAYQSQALRNRIADLHATLDAMGRTLIDVPASREALLTRLNAVRQACDFDFVVLLDEQGMGINHLGRENIDLSRRDYFLEAREGRPAVSYVASGAVDTANAFIGLAVPIKRGDRFVGVMYGSYKVGHFIDLLKAQYYVETSFTQVLTAGGDVIVGAGPTEATHPLRTLTRRMLADRKAADPAAFAENTYSYAQAGTLYYAICTPLQMGANDWFIINVVDSTAMRDQESAIRHYALALVVQMSIICALLIFFVVKRERLRQELNLARQEAESANRAKSDFLARISHEMHTPMNAIVGMTRMALKSLHDTGLVHNYLTKINNASGVLLRLIDDVLTLASLEKNRISFDRSPFDFKFLLHSWVSLYFDLAREKGIHFKLFLYGSRVEWLLGDARRLNRTMLCLLANAVKFTDVGGTVSLSVTCRKQAETVFVTFAVSDTGCGMDADMLRRLFTPFEHGRCLTTADKEDSSGLGLVIARRMVEGMGGTIAVDSTPGQGSTFTVSLSFGECADRCPRPASDLVQGVILAYSEDVENSASLVAAATAAGMDLVSVSTSEAFATALRAARDTGNPFAMTLVDGAPDPVARLETLRDIVRAYQPELGIIVLAVHDVLEVRRLAEAVGIHHVLPKPLFVSCLYTVLEKESGLTPNSKLPDLPALRLLLAEDNALNTEIAVELLQSMGFAVDCAEDGKQALDRLLQAPAKTYAAVVTDIQMPVMDGYALARHIRNSEREDIASLPIIAVSANALPDDVARTLESGMQAHVAKPIDVDALAGALRDSLSGWSGTSPAGGERSFL